MKKIYILILLLVISWSVNAQVSFSAYGAVGDGITDDTKALQNALDNESNLIAEPGKTYIVNKPLRVNQEFEHSIDWQGATISSTELVGKFIFNIDKTEALGHHTEMKNLLIDGKQIMQRGVYMKSPTTLTNVDVKNLKQLNTASTLAYTIIIVNSSKSFGNYVLDGCDATNLTAENNDEIGDAQGAAYHIYIEWRATPTDETIIQVKNATYSGSWGEDGCSIYAFNPDNKYDLSKTSSHMYFENLTLKNWERRAIKGFSGNMTWTNCNIYDTNKDHPSFGGKLPSAGLVAAGGGGSKNITFKDCNFIGDEAGNGRDNRVVVSSADDVLLTNCNFTNSSRLVFSGSIGDVHICSCKFGEGSMTTDMNEKENYGDIIFDSETVITEADFFKWLNVYDHIQSDQRCEEFSPMIRKMLHISDEVTIFPNPVHDEIKVLTPFEGVFTETRYSIYNSLGSFLKSGIVENGDIKELGSLNQGTYLLVIETNKKSFLKKFVKI